MVNALHILQQAICKKVGHAGLLVGLKVIFLPLSDGQIGSPGRPAEN